MIQGIIFDVDGVLLDTVPAHFKALKQLFQHYGIPFTFDDYLTKVNGLPRAKGIANVLAGHHDKDLAKLAEQKQVYFLEYIMHTPPKPLSGVIPLLRHLDKKFTLAAASSSKNAPDLLRVSGLAKFFKVIISGNDFIKPKPDPEIFLLAAKRMDIYPQDCVVVEDAIHGIQAAKIARMKTIGLLTSRDAAITREADITLVSLAEKNKISTFLSL